MPEKRYQATGGASPPHGRSSREYVQSRAIRVSEGKIIEVTREHEAGATVADLCRKHGMSSATFYAWKAKYGGWRSPMHGGSRHSRVRRDIVHATNPVIALGAERMQADQDITVNRARRRESPGGVRKGIEVVNWLLIPALRLIVWRMASRTAISASTSATAGS